LEDLAEARSIGQRSPGYKFLAESDEAPITQQYTLGRVDKGRVEGIELRGMLTLDRFHESSRIFKPAKRLSGILSSTSFFNLSAYGVIVMPKPISTKVQDAKLALEPEPKSVTAVSVEQ
jgi:hypothetical protein